MNDKNKNFDQNKNNQNKNNQNKNNQNKNDNNRIFKDKNDWLQK